MADDFNQNLAEGRHYDQMRELQNIRDSLTRELGYYYERVPNNEDEERNIRRGLMDRLESIADRLGDLIKKLN